MMQTMKRSLALFLALMMCLAFLPALFLGTSAAEVTYKYAVDYIYNWGTRGETATFLSPNAEKFYTDDPYDELSAYAGGTGVSDAPKSALYNALQALMKDAHRHETNYQDTRYLYQYTDCQNNGANGGKISSFYSGKDIGPAWDNGGTWNREHTWPDSKGLGGNDENDIMMLRPTASSENGARGNKAYGKSSGYYYPNTESNDKYDVRGDVARIFLYVYVRWGNVNGNGQYTAWGTGGVMESVEVLLEWMEADPVDTWELGRNDSVESITGTRNVFVDYPELAFLLFGEEIPTDMTTPSGEANNSGCDHNNFDAGVIIAANCTEKGYTIFTCQTANCGYSYKSNMTPALGHNYVSGTCTACGEAEPVTPSKPTYVTEPIPGKAYKLGLYSSKEYYFTGSIVNNYYGATDSNYDNGVDVYLEQTNGGYYLSFTNSSGQKQYINVVASGTYRNFTLSSTASTVFTWDSSKSALKTTVSGDVCYIGNYGQYSSMNILTASKLQNSDYIARLYEISAGSDTPACEHNYTATVTAPTCDTEGYTVYTCTLCNDMYLGEKTPAKGHIYAGGTCIHCGAKKPTETIVTISFDNIENRTSYSTSQQVWEQNGITVVNDKASATSNVGDYYKPARFYKGSNVTISYPGMTKIEIDCTGIGSDYISGWLNVQSATATKSGSIITVVFDAPVDSFTYTGLVKQARANSITVYAKPATTACEHINYTTGGAIAATCTSEGRTGTTYCTDCGELLEADSAIPALGHKEIAYEGKDSTCSEKGWKAYIICERCGYTTYEELPGTDHAFGKWTRIKAPTCIEAGMERRDCDNCICYETREIAALDHKDENADNVCDTCNEQMQPEAEEHVCKEVSAFQAFINKIINFFRKLFGMPELCPCGEVILEKEDQ